MTLTDIHPGKPLCTVILFLSLPGSFTFDNNATRVRYSRKSAAVVSDASAGSSAVQSIHGHYDKEVGLPTKNSSSIIDRQRDVYVCVQYVQCIVEADPYPGLTTALIRVLSMCTWGFYCTQYRAIRPCHTYLQRHNYAFTFQGVSDCNRDDNY